MIYLQIEAMGLYVARWQCFRRRKAVRATGLVGHRAGTRSSFRLEHYWKHIHLAGGILVIYGMSKVTRKCSLDGCVAYTLPTLYTGVFTRLGTFGFKNLPPVNGSNNSAPINQGEQSKAKVCRGSQRYDQRRPVHWLGELRPTHSGIRGKGAI